MAVVAPSPSRWRPARPTNGRWGRGCWTACAAHEGAMGPGLLDCLPDVPGWVVGDRGLASDTFRDRIWDLGARPAIPPKRTDPPVACPPWIYANRHLVENLWARLKEWRAIATRAAEGGPGRPPALG